MNMFKRYKVSGMLKYVGAAMLAIAPLAAMAQGKVLIGDCGGEIAVSSTIGVNNGEDGIEVATLFPASMFDKYEDAEVLGVNVGFTSRLNISEVKVWVRETLDGANLFEATLKKEDGIKTGWNKVFGDPAALPEGKDLYVGYTLSLGGASYPVSAVGDSRPGGFLMHSSGEWQDLSKPGSGVLSVEMIATASNLAEYDLVLRQVVLPEAIKIGSTVPLILKIQNLGVETVDSFTVECNVDGYAPMKYEVKHPVESNEYADVEITFTPSMQEKCNDVEMNVSITEIDGGVDADVTNNSCKVHFSLNRFEFVKRLLMEEFSTEKCSNCPTAASLMHQLLEEPEFEDRIYAMVHHVGYYTDWLTIPVSNNYLWFFGGGTGSTFAPGFMYDRYSFDNSSPVNNGTDDYSSIKQKAEERLSLLPMTALEASAVYDPDTESLNIHVEGERIRGYEGNRLTICVVENNIPARVQAGASGEFIHQHVARDINEIWGYQINWEDDAFTHDTSIYYNPAWLRDNVEIYAFMSNYDSTNYKNCTIDNVIAASLDLGYAAVDEINDAECGGEPEYYTLSGLKVQNPSAGMYIVKRGTKVTKEYIR